MVDVLRVPTAVVFIDVNYYSITYCTYIHAYASLPVAFGYLLN